MDPYRVLGLSKGASADDIKKAYKKLARENHPDKGGSEDKFKEISEAYEILTNSAKKAEFDFNPFDMFFNIHQQQRAPRPPRKCNPRMVQINVTLEQLYFQTKIFQEIELNQICGECHGAGGKDPIQCGDCHGSGYRIIKQQIGPGIIQQMQTICSTCRGEGNVIPEDKKCGVCNGKKVCPVKKKFQIEVRPDMIKVGEARRFQHPALGDEYPGMQRGDIIFTIVEEPHPVFKREGNDLWITRRIKLVEALTGGMMRIQRLNGTWIEFDITNDAEGMGMEGSKKVVKPGMKKYLAGEGISQGQMVVEFEIDFPDTIDFKYVEDLRKILS